MARPYQEDEMYVRAMLERNYGFMCAEFCSLWDVEREQVDNWFDQHASLLSEAERADVLDLVGPYDYGTWQNALETLVREVEFEEYGIVGPLVVTRTAVDGHSLTNESEAIEIPAGARATIAQESEVEGLYDLHVEYNGRWYWAPARAVDFDEVEEDQWDAAGG